MKAGIRVLAALLVAAASGVQAHDEPTTLFCDYELGYDVLLDRGEVRLSDRSEQWHLRDDRLYRNGREQALTPKERKQLARYREEIERLVPAVSALAVEGAMLGVEAATLTLALLGDDDDADALGKRLAKVSERLQAQLDGRRLSAGRMGDKVVDTALEEEIGDIAGDAAMKITGNLASFVFGAIFNPAKAEARGVSIERTVERRIEPRAEALGKRADALCVDLRKLDAQERELGRFDLLRAIDPEV